MTLVRKKKSNFQLSVSLVYAESTFLTLTSIMLKISFLTCSLFYEKMLQVFHFFPYLCLHSIFTIFCQQLSMNDTLPLLPAPSLTGGIFHLAPSEQRTWAGRLQAESALPPATVCRCSPHLRPRISVFILYLQNMNFEI